jgi:hypothetical protein
VEGFRFPLIVKPSARGATAGDWVFRLQILDDADALARCLSTIAAEYPGREFQVAENIPGEHTHAADPRSGAGPPEP